MGDELALTNDYAYADDPDHADDNGCAHRLEMPWDVAERRHDEGSVEHRIWPGLRPAITVRASLPGLDAST